MNEEDWAYLVAAICTGAFLAWVAWIWVRNPPPAHWLRDHHRRERER
jgi:hypothetical protein